MFRGLDMLMIAAAFAVSDKSILNFIEVYSCLLLCCFSLLSFYTFAS